MELVDIRLFGIVIMWGSITIIILGGIGYILFDRPYNSNKDRHITIVKIKKKKKKKKNKYYSI